MNKSKSTIIVFIWYLIAAIAAFVLFQFVLPHTTHILYKSFLANVLATVVIFIGSSIYKNSSVYDPYWSVVPPIILMYWNNLEYSNIISFKNNILLLVVLFWAVRLTLNWHYGWKGLQDEDWRYTELRKQHGKWFPLVNFFGIHLFPTLLVFIALIPCYYTISAYHINIIPLYILGVLISIVGILFELYADIQSKKFRALHTSDDFITTGLWKYSRHPNYFGEILFWFGLYVIMLSCDLSHWYYGIGFLLMFGLFYFISIPLMEKRNLSKRKNYHEYINAVSKLFPWKSKL